MADMVIEEYRKFVRTITDEVLLSEYRVNIAKAAGLGDDDFVLQRLDVLRTAILARMDMEKLIK